MGDVASIAGLLSERERELIRELARVRGQLAFATDTDGTVIVVDDSGWNDEIGHPTELEAQGLGAAGVVDSVPRRYGWGLRVNQLGLQVAAELARRDAASPGTAVLAEDLLWQPAVVGHLRSIYDAWLAAGAPAEGVNVRETTLATKSDATVRLVLEQLHEGEFVRFRDGYTAPLGTAEGTIPNGFRVPTMVTPLNATVSFFGGWPSSPQAAQEQLLAALDARLTDPSTSVEERGALQSVRDNFGQLAAGTVWAIMTGALGIPAA